MVTIDAHLGDALFRINCSLHFRINEATGWLQRPPQSGAGTLPKLLWATAESENRRKYQTLIVQGDKSWVAFAPSSPDQNSHYMAYYCNRINAAGWRPDSFFPMGVDMRGVDLAGASLVFPYVGDDVDVPVIARFARLSHANFIQVYLPRNSDFSFTFARNVRFLGSVAEKGVDFTGAHLEDAEFGLSAFETTKFDNASLSRADFENALLKDVNLAQLKDANLKEARLVQTGDQQPQLAPPVASD